MADQIRIRIFPGQHGLGKTTPEAANKAGCPNFSRSRRAASVSFFSFVKTSSMLTDAADDPARIARDRGVVERDNVVGRRADDDRASAVASLTAGFLLNATGFDVELGALQSERALFLMRVFDVSVPLVTSVVAIVIMWTFEVTEERAHEIRAELEKRRTLAG